MRLPFAPVGGSLHCCFPRVAVGVAWTSLLASYLLCQVGPFLRLPYWALDFSVFKLYGNPLLTGIDWTGLLLMSAAALVGFATALWVMQTREVGS